MENFLFSSAAGPPLPLAQHSKGKQIAKLNTDLKIGTLLYLAERFRQGENEIAAALEDIFPLCLEFKNQCWDSPRWAALFEAEFSWTLGGLQKSKCSEQQVRTAWRAAGEELCETHCPSCHD